MGKVVWIGGAPAVAQVDEIELPVDIEAGQVLKATIGLRELSYTLPDGPLKLEVVAAFVELWNDSEIPEFDVITATDNGDGSFELIADEEGRPFIVSFVIGNGTNEIQVITLMNNPVGGTFTLNLNGQVTGNIAYDSTAATLKTALETLATIAVDDVAVTGGAGGPWTVTFQNNLAGTDVSLLMGDATNLVGVDEVQVVTLHTATGGTFTLAYEGYETAGLAHNITGANLQTALEGLTSIGAGNVAVAGDGPYTVTFQAGLGKINVNNLVFDGANLTGTLNVSIADTSPGGGGSNERHILQAHLADSTNVNGVASLIGDVAVTGGTWDLSIRDAGPENTSQQVGLTDIPWDVTVAELQALIDAGSSGNPLNKYRIFSAHDGVNDRIGNEKFSSGVTAVYQFANPSRLFGDSTDHTPQLIIDNTNLTGGTFTYTSDTTGNLGDTNDYGTGSGSWRFIIDGNATDDLSPTISAADLQTAIEGLAAVGVGNVAVLNNTPGSTGFSNGGIFLIDFIGDLANQATGFTITTSKSAGSTLNLQVFTGYAGTAGTGEVQTLSISGSPVSGNFGLRFGTDDTGALDYNSTAATIQAALEGLPSIGVGNVVCTGGVLPGADVVITFAGALSGLDVATIQKVSGFVVESVAGGIPPTVKVTTIQSPVTHTNTVASSGPNDWNTPANWDTNTVPGNGDDVEVYDGEHILYGLDQSAVSLNLLQTKLEDVEIGLPRRGSNGAVEYLPRFLELGGDPDIIIGIGEGSGSERINLGIGTGSPKIEIHGSGAGQNGEPAVQIRGVKAVNTATLLVLDGEVGVAVLPKEEAYFSRITERDGDLFIGSDVEYAELIVTGGDFTSDRSTLNGVMTI